MGLTAAEKYCGHQRCLLDSGGSAVVSPLQNNLLQLLLIVLNGLKVATAFVERLDTLVMFTYLKISQI